MSESYEVVIIGGGPAGLTAGLYASRAGLKSLLLEKGVYGGQITNSDRVENYPGFPEGISGMELGERLRAQADKYGLNMEFAEVTALELPAGEKTVKTADADFVAKAVVLAGGSVRKKLQVPGEAEFTGKGVSYCATCDGAFFQDLPVVVVGGGDAALTEALHLTRHASQVTLIHRRHQFRATRVMQDRVLADKKINVVWDTVIEAVEGDDLVRRVKVVNVSTGKKEYLDTAGVFVSVGFDPATELVRGLLPLDQAGHVITNEKMETNIPGVLAAGDIRHNSGRQAITAAGDGATAAIYAQRHLTDA